MLTFVHTADWHLGRSCQRIGPRSAESHGWRFDSVRRTFDLATRERAAFILVGGDVFQSETPTERVVQEALDLLRDAPLPTILIPGNHDPWREGSIWRRDDFLKRLSAIPNARFASQCEPIEFDAWQATVYPCPVHSKSAPEDLTAWIPPGERGGGRYRIGLAHGFHQRYDGQERFENFIHADRANLSGLDYLALGDLHSYTLPEHPAARNRTYYAGTVECTAVDEERPGHALLVRLEAPGAEPQVQPVFVGHMRPVRLPECVLSPGAGFEELKSRVASLSDPANMLLGLTVRGALAVQEMDQFETWAGSLLDRFLGVELHRENLYREPTAADFEELELDPSEARVLELLRDGERALEAIGWPEHDAKRAACGRPQVFREALSMYYRALREVEPHDP